MEKKTFYRVILLALILFFALQFLSHTFLIIGERKPGFQDLACLKLSSLFFPIDAAPPCEYGFALLNKQRQSPGNVSQQLETGIDYLKRSIHVNMLYYQAHFYLGNAYLYKNIKDPTHLDQAVGAFKRAAQIRGYRPRLSTDVMKLLLSLWPFLRKEDKTFCTGLLDKSLKRLKPGDFNSLLDTWGLYSRDVTFFQDVLKKRPGFYLAAAEKMLRLNIHLAKRQEFLSSLAASRLSDLRNLYQHYLDNPAPGLQEKLTRLSRQLLTQPYIDYYLLKPGNKFNQKHYFEFKKRLNLHLLRLLFAKKGWQKNLRQRSELRTYILSHIEDLSSIEELNAFYDFLERETYFELSPTVLGVFYIDQLLRFKSGQYDTVISEIENFRKSVSFVKTGHLNDYSDILLLLTDTYISSDLLIQALAVLKEIEITAANQTGVYWRKMRIEAVIGPEDEKTDKISEQKNHQYELIRGSRRIELSSPSMKKTVYLIDNYPVEIQPGNSLKKNIKSFHLLQVFVNGRLFYEAYPGQLTFPVKISLPAEQKYSSYTLGIKLLQ